MTACRTRTVTERCGCRLPHMANIAGINDTVPFCTLEQSLYCVLLAKHIDKGSDCICAVPCSYVTYSPELSYALLNAKRVEDIFPNMEEKAQQVQSDYSQALETRSMYFPWILQEDEDSYKHLISTAQQYVSAMDLLVDRLNETTDMRSIYRPDLIAADYHVLQSRYLQIRTWMIDNVYIHPNNAGLQQLISIIENYIIGRRNDWSSDTEATIALLETCAALEQQNGTLPVECSPTGPELSSVMSRISGMANDSAIMAAKTYLAALNNAEADYMHIVWTIYEEGLNSSADHETCLGLLRNNTPQFVPVIEDVIETLGEFYNATTNVERLSAAYKLWAFSNRTQSDPLYAAFVDPVVGFLPCLWYKYPDYWTAGDPMMGYEEVYTTYLLPTIINFQFGEMATYTRLNIFNNRFGRNIIGGVLTPFEQRLAHNMTKADLARQVKRSRYWNDQGVAETTLRTVGNMITDSFNQVNAFAAVTDMLASYVTSSSLPMLTDSVLASLKYPGFHNIQNLNKDNYRWRSSQALQGKFIWKKRIMDKQMSEVLQHMAQYKNTFVKVATELNTFLQLNQMDEEFFSQNYVKLDIFYKDLSYGHVNQQVAFSFISLLSEIGGFLGLLLGASVLTVCEILDFLVFAALRSVKKERNKTSNTLAIPDLEKEKHFDKAFPIVSS